MKFMLLIYVDPANEHPEDSPEALEEIQQWTTYSEEMWASGVVESGAALMPASTATTVRVRNDETLLTDGPFAETKEMLAGFSVIDVPDLDAALVWAGRAPNVAHGSVEVRPVIDMEAPEG